MKSQSTRVNRCCFSRNTSQYRYEPHVISLIMNTYRLNLLHIVQILAYQCLNLHERRDYGAQYEVHQL